MIYVFNTFNQGLFYFVDQATYDANPNYSLGTLVVGIKEDAEIALNNERQKVLQQEAVRFSVCATFVNGNDTTWREVQESDPEDTICQVFDTFTGTYTQCANKTEAYALNEQKKQAFLVSISLDSIKEIEALPEPITKAYSQNVYGQNVGDIPVEVM